LVLGSPPNCGSQYRPAFARSGAADELEAGLAAQGATIFAAAAERLPNTSYFAFDGIDGETLVGKLDRAGFAVAAGAACSSANPNPPMYCWRWVWRRNWHVVQCESASARTTLLRRCAILGSLEHYNLATQGPRRPLFAELEKS
jgi:hypothetical protein